LPSYNAARRREIARVSKVALYMGAALIVSASVVAAQSSGGSFVLRKYVIADGGVQASGDAVDVTATAGQVAPGVALGGSFRATLGFHPAASGGALPLFRDGFE
jgi:hypothetical protein